MNTPKPARKYLVFSSVDSARSAHETWLQDEQRDFDVALYVYRGEINDPRVDFVKYQAGFKFPNFYDFAQHVDVLRYDAVWIVDDDIRMDTAEINRMFELFSRYGLMLGQPAYTADSHSSWQICFQDDLYHLRYTNYCENGVAIFSPEALRKCLPAMQDVKTGWGSEYVFYQLIGEPEKGVGIIDDVICTHPDHPSSLDLLIPRSFHNSDYAQLQAKYGCRMYAPLTLGGIRKGEAAG